MFVWQLLGKKMLYCTTLEMVRLCSPVLEGNRITFGLTLGKYPDWLRKSFQTRLFPRKKKTVQTDGHRPRETFPGDFYFSKIAQDGLHGTEEKCPQ
jgi:hypothetical protein